MNFYRGHSHHPTHKQALNSPPHYRSRNLAAILIGIALLASPSCANPETVLLPFRSIRSLILVDAKVNGNPATLVLDTGANNSIINSKKYGKVQAPRIEAISKGPGIVGDALRLRVDLEIGGRFLFSQPVSVMNLDDLPKRVGAQFDGLLGQDILRQFRPDQLPRPRHRTRKISPTVSALHATG